MTRKMYKKKCDTCGYMQESLYPLEEGDSCDSCCDPLFNEYGKFANCEVEDER